MDRDRRSSFGPENLFSPANHWPFAPTEKSRPPAGRKFETYLQAISWRVTCSHLKRNEGRQRAENLKQTCKPFQGKRVAALLGTTGPPIQRDMAYGMHLISWPNEGSLHGVRLASRPLLLQKDAKRKLRNGKTNDQKPL